MAATTIKLVIAARFEGATTVSTKAELSTAWDIDNVLEKVTQLLLLPFPPTQLILIPAHSSGEELVVWTTASDGSRPLVDLLPADGAYAQLVADVQEGPDDLLDLVDAVLEQAFAEPDEDERTVASLCTRFCYQTGVSLTHALSLCGAGITGRDFVARHFAISASGEVMGRAEAAKKPVAAEAAKTAGAKAATEPRGLALVAAELLKSTGPLPVGALAMRIKKEHGVSAAKVGGAGFWASHPDLFVQEDGVVRAA